LIVGLGTDLVEIARLEEALERTPSLRERLFTASEARVRSR
jgi:holo-[acyl-carrier protein] synthase